MTTSAALKYHFIHIPKTGGMTVRHFVKNTHNVSLSHVSCLHPEYYKELKQIMKANGEHEGVEHARYQDLAIVSKERTFFACVRNPWARVVSRYTFMMHQFENKNPRMKKAGYEEKTFEEFLEERHKWGNVPYYWHRAIRNWYPQKDHVVDKSGDLCVDVLRTEELYGDFLYYFGVPLRMHKRNVSNVGNKDYKDFYNEQTRKIIGDWYGEDIEFFGFTFEGPATKNFFAWEI